MKRLLVVIAAATIAMAATAAPALARQRYQVQSGDTLARIAVRFDTTVEALAAANGISDADVIYVGDWLRLDAGEASIGSSPPSSSDDSGVWAALAQCESGMTNANSGNGFYGYFQFVPETWNQYRPGLPTDYSYAGQLEVARLLQADAGWDQWPGCASQLGLL